MRYYKDINDGYILAIGTGGGGTEITETEYNQIMAVIQNKPKRTETTDYHLKADLTWEEYARPIEAETMKATENIPNGQYFEAEDRLFFSKATIATGDDIVIGTNAIETTISEELNNLKEE